MILKMTKLDKDIQNLTRTEQKVLYEIFFKGSLVYISEKQVREKLGRKSSVHALLNGLADKDFLHKWENAENKGINLYHFSDRISRNVNNKSKLIEAIRPKYFCNQCQEFHFIDSSIGRMHMRKKGKSKKSTQKKKNGMEDFKVINGKKYALLKMFYWKDEAEKGAEAFKKSAKYSDVVLVKVLKGKYKGDDVWGIYYHTKKSEKSKVFKPTRVNMYDIGTRCERITFPLKMERQGDEWIIRLNYDRAENINGISYYASIIYKEIGSDRKSSLDVLCGLQTVSGKFDTSFFRIIEKYNKQTAKKYDEMGLKVFGKKVTIYAMKMNPNKNQITFGCRINLTGKEKLTAKEMDFISDFMHGVFGVFRQEGQIYNIR